MPLDWKNAAFVTPSDKQKILISIDGIYFDAVYHKTKDTYVPTKLTIAKFRTLYFTIYWCEAPPPNWRVVQDNMEKKS
jgi:hypothetical protein